MLIVHAGVLGSLGDECQMKILLTTWLAFWVSVVDNDSNTPLLVTPLPYLDLASSKMSLHLKWCFFQLWMFFVGFGRMLHSLQPCDFCLKDRMPFSDP